MTAIGEHRRVVRRGERLQQPGEARSRSSARRSGSPGAATRRTGRCRPRRRRCPSPGAIAAAGMVDVVGPGDHGSADQPHDEGRQRQHRQRSGQGAQSSSSWTRSPDSSALGTNPRAPERETSGPKSDESRTGDEDHRGGVRVTGDALRDVEAVDVGQLHVQQHQLRAQPARLRDRARAVHRLADDVEPLGLEQHARAGPKGRVVVDYQDGAVHGFDSRHRANAFTYGWPYNA